MDISLVFVGAFFFILIFLYLLSARKRPLVDDIATDRVLFPMKDLEDDYRYEAENEAE